MRWLVAIALLAIVVRRVGTERIVDAVRWADQCLELFSPRGAALYARFAVPLLEPLYRRVADEMAALAPGTVLDIGTGPGARYDTLVPRFVYVDGPRDGMVDFRNLLAGEIPVDDGFYRLTNRTRDGIVEYRWQEPVATPPPPKLKPKPKPKPKRKAKP